MTAFPYVYVANIFFNISQARGFFVFIPSDTFDYRRKLEASSVAVADAIAKMIEFATEVDEIPSSLIKKIMTGYHRQRKNAENK
jgi:hypothetical protein